jgi:competence protein ComEA
LAAQYEASEVVEPSTPMPDDAGARLHPTPEAERTDEPTRPGRSGRHAASAAAESTQRLTQHHIAFTALVVAVAVVAAAWWVLRSASHTEPVQLSTQHVDQEPTTNPAPTPTGHSSAAGVPPGPTPTGGTPAPSASAGTVVVDVAGKVRRPGIVELPLGSRVVDALDAAGGAKPAADTSALNLARLLVDGEQVVVGVQVPALAPTTTSPSGPAAVSPVNLNTATPEQLDTLPGIGPVTAAAILQWRDEHGGFTSVDELLEVSGIGPATMADVEALVYV